MVRVGPDGLLATYTAGLGVGLEDVWARAAANVLKENIVQGDPLAMTTATGDAINFAE